MLLQPDGLQGPPFSSVSSAVAKDIKIAVVRTNLEILPIESVPVVENFLYDVVALAELETNRAFVPSSTCEAFNLDLHTDLLGLRT
jgi:hypothetical protein